MVRGPPSSKGSAQAKQCQTWLQILLHSNKKEPTQETLSEYFLQECMRQPKVFVIFLLQLEKGLRTLRSTKRKHLAWQYLHILSPICERFSLAEEKDVLDALCFRIAEPKHAKTAEKIVSRYKKQSGVLLQRIGESLHTVLQSKSFAHTLQGRFKNPWSIWRKLNGRAAGNPLNLKDIFAFRIILRKNNTSECYEVLHLLHDRFRPIPGNFKDYISIPKINGYQSIHTVLHDILPDFKLPVEIQIRTKAMHEFAEHGLASHWIYSRRKHTALLDEKERRFLRHVKEMQPKTEEKKICCLTPAGDVHILPEGSSIIDFAYRIHTDIGDRLVCAYVHGRQQTAEYAVQEGDRIEILVADEKCVCQKWLQFSITPYAHRRIYEQNRS